MTGAIAHDQADALRAVLRGVLVTSGGDTVEVPDATREALLRVLDVLETSPEAVVFPADAYLTSGQAAEVLGISRMTVTRLVDKGELEATGTSVHRRIAATEVSRYQDARRRSRREAVRTLAQDVTSDSPADRAISTR